MVCVMQSFTPRMIVTMRQVGVLLYFLAWAFMSRGQSVPADSIAPADTVSKWEQRWNQQPHSTLKATMYSVALPGLGQWYNGHAKTGSYLRRYWKIPVVYAALGTSIGFIVHNSRQYRAYRSSYIAMADSDPSTIPSMNLSLADLDYYQDGYHKRMDVSYLALIGVYVLQVIDANVDAHLFYFDISRDLSMRIQPDLLNLNQGCQPGFRIGLNLHQPQQRIRLH